MATTTKAQTLDELRAEVARAEVDLAERTARMEAEASQADERRLAGLRHFDQQLVDGFDQNALGQAVNDAERALDEAILHGTWPQVRDAFVAVNRSREVRRATTDRAKAAYTALGVELHEVGLNGPTPLGQIDLTSRVEQVLLTEAIGQAQDRDDAAAQARIDAGETAALGK